MIADRRRDAPQQSGHFRPCLGETENVTTELIVSHGYVEVTDNRVIILAETAEFLHEVDRERAEKAKSKAEAILLKTELSEEDFKEAQDDLFRAIARLEHTESK